MSVQMIELEEVQMTVTSDDVLEAMVVEVTVQASSTGCTW
jgi:uncharacterized protein YunC (DUF1805 family)